MPLYKATITNCPKCDGEVLLIDGHDSCLKCQRIHAGQLINPDSIPPDWWVKQHEEKANEL